MATACDEMGEMPGWKQENQLKDPLVIQASYLLPGLLQPQNLYSAWKIVGLQRVNDYILHHSVKCKSFLFFQGTHWLLPGFIVLE